MNSFQKTLNSINLDSATVSKFVEKVRNDPNFTSIAIITAVAVIVFTLREYDPRLLCFMVASVVLRLFRRSTRGNNVLIVGLTEAGKTVMFGQLFSRRLVETVTSMKPNYGSVELEKKSAVLVDLPGYERLRERFWDDYKENALGIIFVVDSVAFMSNLRDVAALLYSVLTDATIMKKRIPLLVACNKQDEPKAKSAKVIQSQLEKEINVIRETRHSQLSYTDESSGNTNVLGDLSKDFQFSSLKSAVEFVDCIGKAESEEARLEDVWKWLRKVV